MHHRWLFFMGLLCFASATAETESPTIAPNVESVVSGGNWQMDNQDGRYRIIIVNGGFEHIFSHVFLQWIETGTREQGPAILFSTPVEEINRLSLWSIGTPEYILDSKQFRLSATNTYTYENTTFLITPDNKGKYHLEKHEE
jgi:hypothetical protein